MLPYEKKYPQGVHDTSTIFMLDLGLSYAGVDEVVLQ